MAQARYDEEQGGAGGWSSNSILRGEQLNFIPSTTFEQLPIDCLDHLEKPYAKNSSCESRSSTMSATRSARCLRQAVRNISVRPAAPKCLLRQPRYAAAPLATIRYFSNVPRSNKGIFPETDNPEPKESEPLHEIKEPTPLEDEEYHERAEQYLDEVVTKAEELQEEKQDIDVEYAVCFDAVRAPLDVQR